MRGLNDQLNRVTLETIQREKGPLAARLEANYASAMTQPTASGREAPPSVGTCTVCRKTGAIVLSLRPPRGASSAPMVNFCSATCFENWESMRPCHVCGKSSVPYFSFTPPSGMRKPRHFCSKACYEGWFVRADSASLIEGDESSMRATSAVPPIELSRTSSVRQEQPPQPPQHANDAHDHGDHPHAGVPHHHASAVSSTRTSSLLAPTGADEVSVASECSSCISGSTYGSRSSYSSYSTYSTGASSSFGSRSYATGASADSRASHRSGAARGAKPVPTAKLVRVPTAAAQPPADLFAARAMLPPRPGSQRSGAAAAPSERAPASQRNGAPPTRDPAPAASQRSVAPAPALHAVELALDSDAAAPAVAVVAPLAAAASSHRSGASGSGAAIAARAAEARRNLWKQVNPLYDQPIDTMRSTQRDSFTPPPSRGSSIRLEQEAHRKRYEMKDHHEAMVRAANMRTKATLVPVSATRAIASTKRS